MKQLLLIALSALFCMGSLLSQQTVTGTVTDTDGEPLIGASVSVQGTTVGTITDLDGNFSIDVPEPESVIVISYTGYESQRVELEPGQTELRIELGADVRLIDEVLVTGYQQQDRERITGAISTVESARIEQVPIASFDQILQGRSAGLMILGASGQPGSTASQVLIRGTASSASNQPLYIVDGIAVGSDVFNSLNPNDIESVTVLKDASSAAIYGASGGNGVIIVTTKSHERGQPTQFTYRGSVGVNTNTTGNFEMMNAREKLDFEERVMRGPGWVFSPNNPNYEGDGSIRDSLANINTNWRDEVLQTGVFTSHELSISGATEQSDFFVSGRYYYEEGQVVGSDFERGTVRFNFNHRANDWLRMGIRSNLAVSESNFITSEGAVNLNNPVALAYLSNPYDQVFLDDGSYQVGAAGRNFIEDTDLNENIIRRTSAVISSYFEADILPRLTARTNWGVRYQINETQRYINPESLLSATVQGSQGSLNRGHAKGLNLTGTTTLAYSRLLDVHEFRLMGGHEYSSISSRSFNFTGFGLTSGLRTPAGVTPGTGDNGFIPTVGGAFTERAITSYFGEVNYTYDSRYNVSASLRRDGSSVFGVDSRYGNFFSAGVSWNVSREAFFNVGWLDELKLALSYGELGSEQPLGNYQALTLYNPGSYGDATALIPSTPGNPDLRWEAVKGFNFNVEFAALSNRLFGEISLYSNESQDILLDQRIPLTTGWRDSPINAGDLRNRGIEVELEGVVMRTPDFVWSVGVNYAYNDNEIISLGQVSEFEVGTSIWREGLPIGTHFEVEWAGVDPATGNALYYDLNGNITNVYSSANRVAHGTYIPPHNGSVFTDISYRNFTFSALGVFAAGHEIFNNQTFFITNPTFTQFNQSKDMLNAWSQPGDVTNIQRLDSPRNFSSKDIEKADFFRLRNVTIGYNFDVDNLGIGNTFRSLRVYAMGQNLFTVTNFTGFDPEINNNIAQFEYPPQRTFTFGIDIGF